MVFSEHSRQALLNPSVLMKMFGIQGGSAETSLPQAVVDAGGRRATSGHFFKPAAAASLRNQYATGSSASQTGLDGLAGVVRAA